VSTTATRNRATAPRPAAASPLELAQRLLLGQAWPWVALWVLTRCWMLHQWAADYSYIQNDVKYYFGQLGQAGGYPVTLREYPLPVVWLLDVLRAPVDGSTELYVVVFALLMAVLDAAFAVWLWQGHSKVAALFWMAFGFCLGPLIWFRYDLLAGVVVGVAVFLLARRPSLSGALIALGAGIKLWPALLIAAAAGTDAASRRRLLGFGGAGLGLALASLWSGGLVRLVSPLTWQSGRGLQIESVWATPLMWLRGFGVNPPWLVEMSAYNAFEVFGPWAGNLQRLSDLSMVVGVGFAALVGLACLTQRPLAAHHRAMACVAIVLVMLTCNKTLSPQYLSWLGAVVAAWLGLSPRGQRARASFFALASLALATATQYVYPIAYGGLIGNPGAEPVVTAVLVARNLALAGLTLLACGWTLQELWRSRREQRQQA